MDKPKTVGAISLHKSWHVIGMSVSAVILAGNAFTLNEKESGGVSKAC